MGEAEVGRFRQILEAQHAELTDIFRRRDGVATEKCADDVDEAARIAEHELAARNLDRESKLLRNIEAALRRIDGGSFGICAHCEEEISPKRLAAVPWATFCLKCQEATDRNGHEAYLNVASSEAYLVYRVLSPKQRRFLTEPTLANGESARAKTASYETRERLTHG